MAKESLIKLRNKLIKHHIPFSYLSDCVDKICYPSKYDGRIDVIQQNNNQLQLRIYKWDGLHESRFDLTDWKFIYRFIKKDWNIYKKIVDTK